MGPLDTALHLINFVLPALAAGAMAAGFARLLWRRDLRSVAFARLWAWASAGGLLALVAGLWIYGRDGRIESWLGLAAGCAAGVWWAGWRLGGRR